MAKKTKTGPFTLSCPPTLSPVLNKYYNSLDDVNKVLFKQIFSFLWGVVFNLGTNRKKPEGILFYYWCVDHIREKYNLTNSELSYLAYLYHATSKGRRFVCSADVYNNQVLDNVKYQTRKQILLNLHKRALILRSWSNPDEPYLQKSYRSRPVFLRLTPAGVDLVETMEKDLYKVLLNSSLNDLTGGK